MSLSSETDPRRIDAVYQRLATFRDSSLFATLRQTLADEGSSTPVRVYSAMSLVDQLLNGREADYPTFADTSTAPPPCALGYVADQTISVGAPLPTDARGRVRVTASEVAARASTPPSVRRSAQCLVEVLDREESTQSTRPSLVYPRK